MPKLCLDGSAAFHVRGGLEAVSLRRSLSSVLSLRSSLSSGSKPGGAPPLPAQAGQRASAGREDPGGHFARAPLASRRPPARRTRLPPNLNASSAGRAGLRRPTDPGGLPTRSSGRRAARAAGLQLRDVAFSLMPSTSRDRAAVRARTGVPRGPFPTLPPTPQVAGQSPLCPLLSARFSCKAIAPSPRRCPWSLESWFCWTDLKQSY